MNSKDNDWGAWTEEKLDALAKYMQGFTTACYKKAKNRIYLDLFAGTAKNKTREMGNETFFGSTVRALNTDPQFTHLRFIECEKAEKLTSELAEMFPNDDRYKVISGDCNQEISVVLEDLSKHGLSTSPTLAFIDPCGLHVKWSTFKAISEFKDLTHSRSKAEMLILFQVPTIYRMGATDDCFNRKEFSNQITEFYGSEAWKTIEDRAERNKRKTNFRYEEYLNSCQERSLFVMLFRYFLEERLGYKITLAIPVDWIQGPKYVLIFATDHDAGERIISYVIKNFISDLNEAKKVAKLYRRIKKEEKKGIFQLGHLSKDYFSESLSGKPNMAEYYSMDSLLGKPKLPDWLEEEVKLKEV